MSIVSENSMRVAPSSIAQRGAIDRGQTLLVALLAGCGLAFLMTLPLAMKVWSTGIFLNPDDAMRAVEVRDFIAGQGWFDLVPHRLSPEHPFVMHWSRLVDLPLAIMVLGFRSVLAPPTAELAMRLIEPALLFILSLWSVIAIADRLMGRRSMMPAALLLAGSVEFVGNFVPGHIHHHGVQVTLLLGATRCLLGAVGPQGRGAAAAWSGVLAALTLGIGLQNLPFVIALSAALVLDWVMVGHEKAGALRGFGLGLSGTSGVVFLLDVPPERYFEGACDAFSAAHLVAAIMTGVVLSVLSMRPIQRRRPEVRLGLAALAGFGVLTVVAATFPQCLRDPMAGVDPLLRTEWLANVSEALPLARLIALKPADGMTLLLTMLIGLGATGGAALRDKLHRSQWLALALMSGVGVVGTLWQVRVAGSACALMIPGLVWIVLRIHRRVSCDPKRPALLIATMVGLIGNGAGIASAASLVGTGSRPASHAGGGLVVDPQRCFEPDAYALLGSQPEGVVLSTIDPGSAILAATDHSVLAAPYHRNGAGNRVALTALMLPPDQARPIIEDAHTRYLALCRFSNETEETVRMHPESISARLVAGDPPDWLKSIGTGQGAILLFEVAAGRP